MLGFNLGGPEIAGIVFAALLLFGAKRIPELMRSLGRGIAEFRQASREAFSQLEEEEKQDAARRQASAPPEESSQEKQDEPSQT